ncbi:PREDICTED: uncharacterized protein LOC108564174 [Nicrophorus vespilloides]|uniref:Uncharacterized protein LOC108564174 n=1 Tax=Nicrophorus vespilloides TaxID=110193 RepID=A0ABM1MVL7_NICVS|nr:PREDICTED: uncharacterized protein LOC108564174 [Nicrophorus vespilloides]
MSNEKLARSVALEQAYVHDVYEQFYDNPRSRPWPRVQEFIDGLEPGSIVCDVGCGNGKYLSSNTSLYSMGGDKCKKLTEVAREKDNEVMVLDNLALPFRDESMDAVLSIAVVHHFSTTERRVCALRELARVLRIGGRLIISVWAMEQNHRKFESQDVLVPWHRHHKLSSPSLELTSTTNTSEDDCHLPYHAYSQISDSDSNKSNRTKKRGKTRSRGRSIDPRVSNSPSSSSLSSPNETCYSFVRRAIQKLAGGRRAVHKPWFLDTWTNCTKDPPLPKQYDADGCECCDCESAHDLPIELRRVDDNELPQRRKTLPSSTLTNDLYNLKSKSMTNMSAVENNNIIRSNSSIPSIQESLESNQSSRTQSTKNLSKPKLVKQKKSICEDDADPILAEQKDLPPVLPDVRIETNRYARGSVLKQRSLNEELMSTERLQEKEKLRRNIHKQASLNEDLIFQRNYSFENLRDSLFSTSTAKRLQLIKTGFTNKIRNTNIDRVTGASLKNGFVRMFQNWKSSDMISPTIPEDESIVTTTKPPETERRHSKEDGSDSSKDSSLQSDTSVDSEDSFASVIFVPKSNPMSPTLSPGPTSPRVNSSVPNSPRIKQSSCPTSPRIKQMPLSIYPLTKQLSSPKPSNVSKFETLSPTEYKLGNQKKHTVQKIQSLAQKYAVVPIPKFKPTIQPAQTVIPEVTTTVTTNNNNNIIIASNRKSDDEKKLNKIKELLKSKPGFGMRVSSKHNYPIVRHSSINNGIAKPLPKLLSLELFNPETDDKDSDSSAVSSPDSADSVISVNSETKRKFTFPDIGEKDDKSMTLLQAAADVAKSLDNAVDRVIKSSPRAKRQDIKVFEVQSVMERQYTTETMPLLLNEEEETNWNDECHKHLTDFADKLSEKLLREIDQYQEKVKRKEAGISSSLEHIDDPYIHRLSEELQDLSKLSAEIQKQNEYLAQLSACDKQYGNCAKCNQVNCSCSKQKSRKNNNNNIKVPLIDVNESTDEAESNNLADKLSKNGASVDSGDSERGSTPNSTSLHFGHSIESNEGFSDKGSTDKDTNSVSRYSDGGSTASLASCPEWKTIKTKLSVDQPHSFDEKSELLGDKDKSNLIPSLSDTSQESLPSDNVGGEITYHRYYHVFREGELDQLIEKYVENLHIISSYYDHTSWCVVAEKVQVWTI